MKQYSNPLPDETLDVIEDVRIIQKKKGHRFTTDSLLLARFSIPKRRSKVLDLGTGDGIVSLLLAKRDASLNITAVEIQREMAELAERNILLNEMGSAITVLNKDIKELPGIFPSSHFDYIITNPPYRPLSSGRTSPEMGRNIAGKEVSVTIKDIVKVSQQLLKVRGKFSIVYTAGRLVDLFTEMRACRIEPKTMRGIHTKGDEEARLAWVEGVKEGKPGIRIFSFSNNLRCNK